MVHEEHSENLRDLINDLVEREQLHDALGLLVNRHPADQADLIEHLERDAQEQIVRALTPEQLGELLEYLEEDLRAGLLADLPVDELVPVLNQVDEDVAADVLQDLPPERAKQVVPRLEWRQYVEELLSYPEESAGGRMSTEVVALRREWTVEEAIWFLRREPLDADQPFYLYVVDRNQRLLGIVPMRPLLTSAPYVSIDSIMRPDVISVHASEDQEVAAELMRRYNLLALPVVDGEDRLVGVITADNVLDVQVEEATEDMFRLAGLPEEERIFRPIRQAVPPRLTWLLINLVTAFLAATTVSAFEGTIQEVAALAIFMPMVAGMGGNAGIQTITLVVRSIALGEIEVRDAMRVLKHEAVIALIKGVVIGVIVGVIAWAWQESAWLGLVVGLALLANIANATLAGVMVPMALKRLRADPALASGVIVTTFSDAVGLLVFLGLATLLIARLT
jgi:magnesium transporter